MTCKITELRRQLESMQSLLDTYEHCHVDSVAPEEKAIVNKTKKACVEAIRKQIPHKRSPTESRFNLREEGDVIKAIQGV